MLLTGDKIKKKNQKEEYSLCTIVLPIWGWVFMLGEKLQVDPTPALTNKRFYTKHGHTDDIGNFLRRLAFALHGL